MMAIFSVFVNDNDFTDFVKIKKKFMKTRVLNIEGVSFGSFNRVL